MRKHYLDTHTTGIALTLASRANNLAAQTEGMVVHTVDGYPVTVIGAPLSNEQVEAFARDAAGRIEGHRAAA